MKAFFALFLLIAVGVIFIERSHADTADTGAGSMQSSASLQIMQKD